MSVKIRLKRFGTKKKPLNRICIFDSHRSRDAKPIEEIGFYNPTMNPPAVKLNKERAEYWIKVGATPSTAVANIFKHNGVSMARK